VKAVAPPENPETLVQPVRGTASPRHTQTLRVLHVIDRLDMGGTEYVMLKVMKGLEGEEFESRVCAARGFNEDLAHLQEWREKIFVAGQPRSGFQLLVLPLRRIMREFRPHIVHSRNWGAIEAVPAARLAGVPVAIHSEHGYIPEMVHGLPRRQRWIRRGSYAMADALFTVTEELRRYHARQAGIEPERFRVIRNGVDTDRFAPRAAKRQEIRASLGIPPSAFVAGIVSRLVSIKDHPTLFRAAEELASRKMDVRVVVAGSGPERERLEAIVNSSPLLAGRIMFLGAQDNVAELLNAFDVFVLPSLTEGMSNTILEAMATGLPVLATRVGGNPELVEDRVTGMLFTPGDAEKLSAQMDILLGDEVLRARYGAEARRRAVADFSLDRMLANYRDLYFELAERKGVFKHERLPDQT
jgi:sugar transferase (PEP-CTERM/EpsH1 system associated)